MSKEILFRAKTKATKEWTYGHFAKQYDVPQIYTGNGHECIHEDTLCQYTGLTDIHGDKIFEGDIITNISDGSCGYVKWNNNCAGFIIVKDNNKHCTLSASEEYEIVANIYYHPMML